MENTRFSPYKYPSWGAAISILADDLRPATHPMLTKQEREALALMMLKTTNGMVTVGTVTVSWKREGDLYKEDVLYRINS